MIVVTGATGHIGNVLVRRLVEKGESVRALYAPGESTKALEGLQIDTRGVDILDVDSLKEACKGADTVFHLAGMISIVPFYQKRVYDVNVNGTKNVLTACRENAVKRLVYVSSIHAFEERAKGSRMDESFDIDPKKAKGAYGKSKALATLEVEKAIREGLDAVIVCPTGVIGPYDFKLSEMGRLFIDVARGVLNVCVHGTFDFVDVRDVAEGIEKAWRIGKKGERYILGGTQIEICDLIGLVEKYSEKKNKRWYLPFFLSYFLAMFASFFSWIGNYKSRFTTYSVHTVNTRFTYSHEKAEKELNYYPRAIQDTVMDTLQWFRQNGFLSEFPSRNLNI